MNADSVSAT